MKHFIVYIAALNIMLTACGGRNDAATSSADDTAAESATTVAVNESSASDEIKTRLKEIYDNQFTGKTLGQPRILSDDLEQLMARVSEIEEAEDEMLGWEFDPWTLAQDISDPSMSIVDVQINDDGSATASLIITDNGEERPLNIRLIRENGVWVADDFIIPGNEDSDSLREDYVIIVAMHNHKAE